MTKRMMFKRPSSVAFTMDKRTNKTHNCALRCPVCDDSDFMEAFSARHSGGDNLLYIGGNVAWMKSTQMRANHDDVWGHVTR
jgi:hypothetical protein